MEDPTRTGSEEELISGSPAAPAPTFDQDASAGQAEETGDAVDNTKSYEELESRLGTQGQELGEYRQFFQSIAPLLDKLDQAPELVQAIVDGQVDKDIAKAVLEGRVDVRDANAVQEAHEGVKAKLGKKAYNDTSPEGITKLVETEVSKFRKEFEAKSDLENFQDYTQDFIKKTPDFEEYADKVDQWLDSHDVTDIEVAYYAVKGQISQEAAKEEAESASAERAKDVLANAGGGGQTSQFTADGTPIVDKLISGKPNPNSFFGGV